MPLFQYETLTLTKQDHLSIRLFADHILQLGDDDKTCMTLNKSLPKTIDIFSQSNLELFISVFWNGYKLSADDNIHSLITHHTIQMLRSNSDALGICNIIGVDVDDNTKSKLILTPQKCNPSAIQTSQMTLVSMHLTFRCKSHNSQMAHTILTGQDLLYSLNLLMDRFLTNQVVKRYPLIFGSRGKKLEDEKPFFSSIAHSIISMIQRSPNVEFRQQSDRYIKILYKRMSSARRRTSEGIADCSECLFTNQYHSISSDEELLCSALRELVNLTFCVPQVKFTPVLLSAIPFEEDLLLLLHEKESPDTEHYARKEHEIELIPSEDSLLSDSEDEETFNRNLFGGPTSPRPSKADVKSDAGILDLYNLSDESDSDSSATNNQHYFPEICSQNQTQTESDFSDTEKGSNRLSLNGDDGYSDFSDESIHEEATQILDPSLVSVFAANTGAIIKKQEEFIVAKETHSTNFKTILENSVFQDSETSLGHPQLSTSFADQGLEINQKASQRASDTTVYNASKPTYVINEYSNEAHSGSCYPTYPDVFSHQLNIQDELLLTQTSSINSALENECVLDLERTIEDTITGKKRPYILEEPSLTRSVYSHSSPNNSGVKSRSKFLKDSSQSHDFLSGTSESSSGQVHMSDHIDGTDYLDLGIDEDDEFGFPVSARFLPSMEESSRSGMQNGEVLDLGSDSDTDCEWDA